MISETKYNKAYNDWQSSIGEFGGWANQTKFLPFLKADDVVMDFGCGGGYLLSQLNVKRKLGIEINPVSGEEARKRGIEVFTQISDCPDGIVDVIISNHALEHAHRPLDELKALLPKLKPGGKCVFIVPCEAISYAYEPNDVNHHLYTWSPMCLGNLFTEAGYELIESKAYIHKWPARYRQIAKLGGRPLFELACRIKGHLSRKYFQVRAVARRPE